MRFMRSFLAGLALLLAGVIGTTALTAYVAHETVLARHNADRLLVSVLEQPALRHQLLRDAVPGYTELPRPVRERVDRLARSRRVDAAVHRTRVEPDGTVHLERVRRSLERGLEDHDLPEAAALLQQLPVDDTAQLPVPVLEDYRAARQQTWQLATVGGLVAVALAVAALVVHPHRRSGLRSAGLTVIAASVGSGVLWWFMPALARAGGESGWGPLLLALRHATTAQAVTLLAPFAGAGVVLALVSFLLPRRRA